MGIAVESVLASRHHALTDTLDTYHPQSRVERTMQWATNRFQFVNMLAPWTDFAKINASMVAGSEILRAVKASTEGKLSARQLRNLGESGIEPHMANGSPRRSRPAAKSGTACTCRILPIGQMPRPAGCSRVQLPATPTLRW
jgi:hypothetical protein